MKIGIVSDTHDNFGNLEVALGLLRLEEVVTLLHCGDVCRPHIVIQMSDFDTWIAQGNMDRYTGMAQTVEEVFGTGRLAWVHKPVLDGYSIAMIHGDNEEALNNLISSGQYDYVFHGHTHRRRDQLIGRTRVINPGALGGTYRQSYSFCILDLKTGESRFIEL